MLFTVRFLLLFSDCFIDEMVLNFSLILPFLSGIRRSFVFLILMINYCRFNCLRLILLCILFSDFILHVNWK